MKTKLFNKLLALSEDVFVDVSDIANLLKISEDGVRKHVRSGFYCGLKLGGIKILSDSFVCWILSEMWQKSLDGRPLVGIDVDELEEMVVRYGIEEKQEK